MRIQSGEAKGKRLSSPRGGGTRPTLGRARETLFGILTPRLPGARFLDLFAGTGSIGIEALSRGAEFAIFVEQEERAARGIRDNLLNTGLSERGRILRSPIRSAIIRLTEQRDSFDLIFSDPPYEKGWNEAVVRLIEQHPQLLSRQGWLIVQQHHKEPVPVSHYLDEFRQRRVGDTNFVFYRAAEH